jgi:hypothetical protein
LTCVSSKCRSESSSWSSFWKEHIIWDSVFKVPDHYCEITGPQWLRWKSDKKDILSCSFQATAVHLAN